MAKLAFKAAAMLLAGVLLGGLFLSLAYLLPLEPIRESVERSLPLLKEEGVHPQKIVPSLNSILDNYTDATMLDLASYEGEKGIVGAMRSERAFRSGEASDTIIALEDSIRGEAGEPQAYMRYWHGYLVVLKPILCLGIDYQGIRVLNAVGQAVLLLVLAAVLVAKRQALLLPPLLVALLCVEFFVIPYSMQYSSVFCIGLIATLIVAWQPAFLRKRQNALLFFMAIGMTTSFFDFLTYPVFAFGIPAATYFYLNGSSQGGSYGAASALALILAWLLGYGAMWAGKWFLASVILQVNVFADVFATMTFRTSMKDGRSNAFDWLTLFKSLFIHYREPEVLLPVLTSLVLYGVPFVLKLAHCDKARVSACEIVRTLFPYAIVFAVPLVWFVVIPNHTFIHNWMTYRGLSVCVYALLLGFLCLSGRDGKLCAVPSPTPLNASHAASAAREQ